MKWINLKNQNEQVSFTEAVLLGLGQDQGLFLPEYIPTLKIDESFWQYSFIERSTLILYQFLQEEISYNALKNIVEEAFDFPIVLNAINKQQYCLELFHGRTLAFKDFGARFLAKFLSYAVKDKKMTILSATSGDTGAAVADAFYQLDNIDVVILYPNDGISLFQEKLFCTLGDNIHTIKVNGSFDDCQLMVKQLFDDHEMKSLYGLTSANSINVARLFAQVCYYFEVVAQLPKSTRENIVMSVPSGNFGNVTACVIAKMMGNPIKKIIASTNSNDTAVRYVQSKKWQPKSTVSTLSNAMDVAIPNNFVRLEYLLGDDLYDSEQFVLDSVSEEQTKEKLHDLYQQGYISEPHAAVASFALDKYLKENECGVFLGTAHSAKFKSAVDSILKTDIILPTILANVKNKSVLSVELSNDVNALKDYFLQYLRQ